MGCWQFKVGTKAKILKDHIDRVKIARFAAYPPTYQSQHLELYYYDPVSGEENHINSSNFLARARFVSADGEEMPMIKPEFVLQVTISSEPSLKEGSCLKKYKLRLGGLEELQN